MHKLHAHAQQNTAFKKADVLYIYENESEHTHTHTHTHRATAHTHAGASNTIKTT